MQYTFQPQTKFQVRVCRIQQEQSNLHSFPFFEPNSIWLWPLSWWYVLSNKATNIHVDKDINKYANWSLKHYICLPKTKLQAQT